MTQNAKGPAEAATSPSHGSNIPSEETKMNKQVNSTAPVAAPAPAQSQDAVVARAMRELESTIRELMHMSDITAETYDTMFGPNTRIGDRNGPSVTYRITKHEDDQMAFLVNFLASRCSALNKSFQAACNGEVLS